MGLSTALSMRSKRFRNQHKTHATLLSSSLFFSLFLVFVDNLQLNASENCIDRHLVDRANDVALIYEADDKGDSYNVT
jgi:hypothetical protein